MSAAPATGLTLTTKHEWRAFVAAGRSARPPMPSVAGYRAMASSKRRRFNEARRSHHAAFGPVETPQMRRIYDDLLEVVETNLRNGRPGARKGRVLDGLGGAGKTTIAAEFGRDLELVLRRRHPGELTEAGADYVPVVFVTLPAKTTVKGLNLRLARFLDIPVPKRPPTTEWLTERVQEQSLRAATALIVIDEIHYLNLRYGDNRDVNNHLKDLANLIPATFLYAGIDVEGSRLFSEGGDRGDVRSQLRRRFGSLPVAPFRADSPISRGEFKSVLMAMESELALFNAEPGMLSDGLLDYLLARSEGFLSTLDPLVKQAANRAIANDPDDVAATERITEPLLESISGDWASEQARRGSKQAKGLAADVAAVRRQRVRSGA